MKTLVLILALLATGSVMAQSGTATTAPASTSVQIDQNTIQTTSYHANGKISEIGYYKNGLKHGTWVTYDENGNKTAESTFENGVREGKCVVYDGNGNIRYMMVYENGKRILTTQWNENGEMIAGVKH
jgi:antitoxin component YwqK of YwqJK toxin-antitoxin module